MQTINSNWEGAVAYVFCHFALRPIQQGIQGAHCLVELVVDAEEDSLANIWGRFDKTVKFLDGGNTSKLEDTKKLLTSMFIDSVIPVAWFFEDVDTLGGLLTSVGIILPGDVVRLLEDNDVFEDHDKKISSLLAKTYGIKAKPSEFKKLINLITRSRWAG